MSRATLAPPPLPVGLEVYRPAILLGTPVLVVDDDHAVQQQLGEDLVGLGYQHLAAFTAAEAREILDTGRVGGVLLDMALGDGDEEGYEVLAWIRERRPGLPVVVLSAAQISSAAIRRAYEGGASSYFVKGNSPLAHIYSDLAARMLEGGAAGATVYHLGPVLFDPAGRTVRLGRRVVALTPQQTALLVHLAQASRLQAPADLIEAGLFRAGSRPSTVHTAILGLRTRLERLETGLGSRLVLGGARGYGLSLQLRGRP